MPGDDMTSGFRGDMAGKKSGVLPYELMKQAILDGELEPGTLLVETALAERYKVSRTPIREALNRLEHDGLVQRNGRGLEVRERSPEEVLDIYDLRIVLEEKAAEIACQRRLRIDVVLLRQLLNDHLELEAPSETVMAQTNRDFHRAVWKASRHESLIDLLTRLDLHVSRYPATTLSIPGRWDEALREHSALLDAIESQDAERAREVAVAHFERARDLRLQIWSKGPLKNS